MKSRRHFLQTSLKAGWVLPLASAGLLGCGPNDQAETDNSEAAVAEGEGPAEVQKLSILILGGTSFLGPHQIAYALSRGHQISTFTRGKTRPTVHQELFDQVEMLIGDRQDDLTALHDREWDVVIDNSGRDVQWTKDTAELLKDKVGLYMYTSSTGVYYPYLGDDIAEDTPLVMEEPAEVEDEEMKLEYWYGVMKTNSEQAARDAFGDDRTIIVRPTYMVGPADKTDRFIHWPIRLSKGGATLVPGKTDDPVQFVDVRDVAEWMIRLAEAGMTGVFNAVGPENATTMLEFVEEAAQTFEVERELVVIDDYDFLMDQGVPYLVPWIMPTGNNYGSSRASNAKARANGMTFRPLSETMQDTHDWWYSDAVGQEKRDEYEQNPEGVLEREASIVAAWEAHISSLEPAE